MTADNKSGRSPNEFAAGQVTSGNNLPHVQGLPSAIAAAGAVRVAEVTDGPARVIVEIGEGHTARLPEGADISQVRQNGTDLEFVQPDGSVVVLPSGAVQGLTLFVGGVEVPPQTVAQLFAADGIETAAGPTSGGADSSHGNFGWVDPEGIGDGLGYADLLAPTELFLNVPTFDERGGEPIALRGADRVNNDVTVTPPTGDAGNPSAGAAGTFVYESGLPGGSKNGSGGETTSGQVSFSAADGVGSIAIGGKAIDLLAGFPQTLLSDATGKLVVTGYSFDPVTGAGTVSYTYTLGANTSGDHTSVSFPVTITDTDGDIGTGTLTVNIVDDAPTANDDKQTQAHENDPVTVDVIGNDVRGADGVDLVNGVKAVAGSLSGGTGVITYNGDGTFTYTPAAGEEGTVTFQYTITDSDGDESTATVTIELQPDSAPVISVAATDVATDDDGTLAGGVSTSGGSVTIDYGADDAGSSFELTGIGALKTADGKVVEFASDGAGGLIGTVDGGARQVITITVTATPNGDGTVTYNYLVTQYEAVGHPGADVEDNVNVQVDFLATDGDGGQTVSGSFDLAVNDSLPVAAGDSVTQAHENDPVTVDVIANDAQGADGVDLANGVKAVAGSLSGGTGVITYNGDGTFTYTPAAGEEGTVTFDYTITDRDGDSSTATVTIELKTDSKPVVVVNNATAVVDEDGLPGASADHGRAGEVTSTGSAAYTGTITVGYGNDVPADALGAIKLSASGLDSQLKALGGDVAWTLSGDGRTLTGAVGGVTVMTVAIVSAGAANAAGQVTYTYEVVLEKSVTHEAGGEDAVALNGISFVVTDADGSQGNGSFDVQVVDDMPVLGEFTTGVIPNETGTVSGLFAVAPGADGIDHFEITGPAIKGITYQTTYGENGTTTLHGMSGATEVFSLTVRADGTYTYELHTPQTGTSKTVSDTTISAGQKQSYFDVAGGTVEIQAMGGHTINPSGAGFGVDNNNIEQGDRFSLEFFKVGDTAHNNPHGVNGQLVEALTFNVDELGSGSRTVSWTAYNYASDGTSVIGSQSGVAQVVNGVLVIDPSIPFNAIEIDCTAGKFKIESWSYDVAVPPPDLHLDFKVVAVDGDGDQSSAQTVHIDQISAASGSDYTLNGTNGDDVIAASAHHDTIVGGNGFDIVDYSGSLDNLSIRLADDGHASGAPADMANPAAGTIGGGDADGDKLTGIEGIIGGLGNDLLIGNSHDNFLSGGAGSDILIGGAGNDILAGGLGNDTLTGGAGNDTFVFSHTGAANADTITDYVVGEDAIDLQELLNGHFNDAQSSQYVNLSASGGNTILSVDTTGSGNFTGHEVATLQGVFAGDVTIVIDGEAHTFKVA